MMFRWADLSWMCIQFTNCYVTYFMDSDIFFWTIVFMVYLLLGYLSFIILQTGCEYNWCVCNCELKDVYFIFILVLFDNIYMALLFAYLHFYIDRQVFFFNCQQKETFMLLYLVQCLQHLT